MLDRARSRFAPWLLAAAALLAACSTSGSSPATGSEGTTPSSSQLEIPHSSTGSGEVPADQVEQVVTDAASGAGVDPSDVEVVVAEAVTWPDGSIGCPQPGQAYTQALVPGFRVVVEIEGEEMSFHAAEDGEFAFCADPQEPVDDGTVDR